MKKINFALILLSLVLVIISCNGPTTPVNTVQDIGGDSDVLPIDRVRLKPSPRAIITWNGLSPKDTIADFWDLGQISAKQGPHDLLVEYINGQDRTVLLQIPNTEILVAQLGVFSYRFINSTQNDQIVIFYSPDEQTIKPHVFNVLNHPPYIEPVHFQPPHSQIINPIPYFDFYCESLKVYSDDLYRDCIATYKYSPGQMTLEP